MLCPNCNSTALRRVSLIHAAGVYESRGRFRGLLFGSIDGALFGQYRGTSQNRLSALSNPPANALYALMSLDARENLSAPMAVLSVAYVFFPGYLLAVLSYNLTIRRKKLSAWRHKFLCMRCGNTITHHH